ncbi:MAG: branched-chain amino acid aminotransferase [Firmicutes bacterium]|nr:branched-chain amino acid aminotransferase [Bacillota bacterium]
MQIEVIKNQNPKQKRTEALGFGKYFSDHMLTMEYADGKWGAPKIVPYAPFSLDPACSVLHYAQGIFEGAKAYKNEAGEVRIFRLKDNVDRLLDSAQRVCIPDFDKPTVLEGIKQLIMVDQDWIPTGDGTALYIRPSIVGTENALGVKSASSYLLFVILSPVGAYYENGMKPVKLFVEEEYVRAVKGGTGGHKVIGNYAASLKAGDKAKAKGYDQVMWLDAFEHKYVEEVGAMNIFFVVKHKNGVKVLTPALGGSILPGITRRSIIHLLKEKGIEVEETCVSIKQMAKMAENGKLLEVFGTGTAAVITPVGRFNYQGRDYKINGEVMGSLTTDLYNTLTGIQCGKVKDIHGWTEILNK